MNELQNTEELKIKRLKFLNDTVNHFNSKNRGIMPGYENICSYESGCAIGRHLSIELCKQFDCLNDSSVNRRDVFELLPDWMKELGAHFLKAVQTLHDASFAWNETGLSEIGRDKVLEIKKDYCLI